MQPVELNDSGFPEEPIELEAFFWFFFQAEDGIRDLTVTGVQTCALPISTASRSSCRPAAFRYSETTWLPGASEVFTHGLRVRPKARALRATRPAPIST